MGSLLASDLEPASWCQDSFASTKSLLRRSGVEGVIGNYPFLASGVNAQVNPCVICRNVATGCDDLAPFASAEVMSFFLGKNGTNSNISFS